MKEVVMNPEQFADACCLCDEIRAGHAPGEVVEAVGASSRTVLSGVECRAIVDLSPLSQFHLLLVPHRHVSALRQLSESESAELHSLRARALTLVPNRRSDVMYW